ncbi:MAG: hypothetical protein KKD44_02435 [Proteobacteria bacterium]|nr:hypothetical protein [Pseudomonadota bacterium]
MPFPNGMRFYNAIIGEDEDPLGPDLMPEAYVKCLNKKWERVKDFDWRDYVDAAWDEGVNFNYFKDEELLAMVLSRLEDELRRQSDDCDCDKPENETERLDKKYRDYSRNLLNLDKPSVLPDSLKPEHLVKEKIHKALSHRFLEFGKNDN